mmetsp:Transcript_18680/g.29121  ORF Transcript_18680/g.29121 Transcript_18680/m.29121 type:complete len:83 (+) Transcript_18680:1039-1287(+)
MLDCSNPVQYNNPLMNLRQTRVEADSQSGPCSECMNQARKLRCAFVAAKSRKTQLNFQSALSDLKRRMLPQDPEYWCGENVI